MDQTPQTTGKLPSSDVTLWALEDRHANVEGWLLHSFVGQVVHLELSRPPAHQPEGGIFGWAWDPV